MPVNKHTVITILRDKILSGELAAGERLAEIPTAELLGVSRTPVRIAFRALENEGLLVKQPRRGYRIRALTRNEIVGSVEVRGVLEGLAARLATEMGLSERTIKALKRLLTEGDDLFTTGDLDENTVAQYVRMNSRFHQCIIAASNNPSIDAALQLSAHLPMASVEALVYNPQQAAREYKRLFYAHQQHHAIVSAMIAGQSARAEALMKEHAHAALNHTCWYESGIEGQIVRRTDTEPENKDNH